MPPWFLMIEVNACGVPRVAVEGAGASAVRSGRESVLNDPGDEYPVPVVLVA